MAKQDLKTFREEWVSEIHSKKSKIEDHSLVDEQKGEKCSETCASKQTTHIVDKKQGSFPAFDLVNNYLSSSSSSTNCKYCQEENLNNKSKGCRNKTSDEEEKKKKDDSLLDLLISDIDEITCIPFFDLELPRELALRIFHYLTTKDLANCCCVNSKWKQLAEDDLLWYNLCPTLNIPCDVECVVEKTGWKISIKNYFLERKRIQSKWKERFCEVRDLENETGGIICCTSLYEDILIVAYLDGTVKLWNLTTASYGNNLKEKYTDDEDIIMAMCTSTSICKDKCAAGFQNGDVMVWKRTDLQGRLIYMHNFDGSHIINVLTSGIYLGVILEKKLIVLSPADRSNEEWAWNVVLEKSFCEKICETFLIGNMAITCLRDELLVCTIKPEVSTLVFDKLVGATFVCLDCTNDYIVVGINSFGYSLLGGYRIRRYSLATGKQCSNIIGCQVAINCMKYSGSATNKVIIGCSDHKIRLHDIASEMLLLTIDGIDSEVTTLQFDDWKVVSGHVDGSVCLWDGSEGTLYWKTQQKHPIRLCWFTEHLLIAVNQPVDKFPRNSHWYADDLMQNKKYRGSIRVLDFTKDTYTDGIPEQCHAEYNDITGYDYNIQLIAPYDDVKTFNLPKI